jgi:hypothetical protein
MKRLMKSPLFVMCLTAAFLAGATVIINAQETPVKNSTSVKNILSEIVRAKGVNNHFTLITPDVVAKLQSDGNDLLSTVEDPCNTAIPITIGQTVGATISPTSCLLDDGSYANFYIFSGTQGQRVTIQMNSSSIDSYLGLANESGTFVVEDDDSGGGLSALIKATLPETGLYVILANTALPNQYGGYTLSLSGAAPCTFSVTPTTTVIPAEGGTFTFNVNTQPECQWRAFSVNNFTTTSSTGTGPGTGTYTVSQNGSGATREVGVAVGSVPLVAAQTGFSVSQPSVACSYSLSPASVNIAPQAMTGSFSIIAPAGCPWTIQTGAYATASARSGTGNATITYSMPHNNGAARIEIIRVGGQEFTINQAGLNCNYKITPYPVTVGRQGGTRTVYVDVQPGCTWSATRNTTWIDMPNVSGVGAGSITFKVAAQPDAQDRSGTIIFYGLSSSGIYIDQSRNFFNSTLDFDGDNKADVSVYRPSSGVWYLNRSTQGFSGIQFGASGDKIVPADYDGDGKTDIAVYRPSNGAWYRLNSSNGTFSSAQFGASEDKPAPADFDGDGKADLAVYRPSNGTWYQMRSVYGFNAIQFGASEDLPVVGDYDNDGRADVAVFRPSNGVWYQMRSAAGFTAVQFGASEDKPVPADYDNDGKTDVAVFRPSSGVWYFLKSTTGFSAFQFGTSEDKPSPADFDGDGKADIAVFRPSNGVWYQMRSTTGFSAQQFGISEDSPAPNAFVR